MNYEEVMKLALERGFYFPSCEVYSDANAGFWEYGPSGVGLKNKFLELWRRELIRRDGMMEIDGSQIMSKSVFEASGHLGNFADPIIKCTKCNSTFRADRTIAEIANIEIPESADLEEFDNAIKENKIQEKKQYENRLDFEIDIINKMGFAGYFLIVSDFVNWAKENKIPVGPGRGSGAGSVAAWSLGITDLDPIKYSLLFERFLNPERVSMPDFDIDFCQIRRDEVIEYVNKKYGSESVAHIITFGTLASRAAVRDIGRVLEVPYGEVDSFAKLIPFNPSNPLTLAESIKSEKSLRDIIDTDETLSNVVDISLKLEGVHRHASTHAAGVVIGDTSLSNIVPLYKDPNTETNATQFSMKYVEKAGLVKFDFLGLTTLSIINECVDLIQKDIHNFSLKNIPLDDLKTFQQLTMGNAVGVFQLESNGMSSVLKQLQPDKFEEIIAVVALFRPGPMDNIPSSVSYTHLTLPTTPYV